MITNMSVSVETQFFVAAIIFSLYKRYNIYYVMLAMSFFRTYMWKLLAVLVVHTIVYIVSSPKNIRRKIFKASFQFIGMMSIFYYL